MTKLYADLKLQYLGEEGWENVSEKYSVEQVKHNVYFVKAAGEIDQRGNYRIVREVKKGKKKEIVPEPGQVMFIVPKPNET